jgi:biopolymer transport protein ExbB
MTDNRLRFLSLLLIVLIARGACAQNFDAAFASAKADLDKSLAELSVLRQKIADEKLPLAKQISDLESQLLGKRKELEKILRVRGSETFNLEALRTEVKGRRDEYNYVTGLLDEYVRTFETRIHIAEVQRYKNTINEAKLSIEDVNLSVADRFRQQVAVAMASMKRLERVTGGDIFEGQALGTDGKLAAGKFAIIGPVAIFASDDGAQVGLSELQVGSPEPSVIDIGGEFKDPIKQITATGSGELPLDASLGSAIKIAATKETLPQHVKKGGPVMVPIILLAIAAFTTALIKWIQLAGIPRAKGEDLQKALDLLNRGDRAQAVAFASGLKGPGGDLLRTAVENVDEPRELLEERLFEKLLDVKPRLERMLPFIAVTASTEPLLGLLGTVTGIINTFKLITVFGTGDPKLLSSGISEALITTEFGLYFAIPALLIHALLSRKVKTLLGSLEQIAVGFLNAMPKKD